MSTTKNKKMTIEVNTIINTFETGYQDKIYKTWKVSGETLDECFKNAYPTERSYRYCTGHSIRFVDPRHPCKISGMETVRHDDGRLLRLCDC